MQGAATGSPCLSAWVSAAMLSATLLVVFLTLLSLLLRERWKGCRVGRNGGLPSPTRLPFLGNLLDLMRKDLPLHFMKLARHYGPIYLLRFGGQDIVVLNNPELIREALRKKWSDFAGRPQSYTAPCTLASPAWQKVPSDGGTRPAHQKGYSSSRKQGHF